MAIQPVNHQNIKQYLKPKQVVSKQNQNESKNILGTIVLIVITVIWLIGFTLTY